MKDQSELARQGEMYYIMEKTFCPDQLGTAMIAYIEKLKHDNKELKMLIRNHREMKDTLKSTMTDQEMVEDYPRLKREYTLLHEDYRRLMKQQKDLNENLVRVIVQTLKENEAGLKNRNNYIKAVKSDDYLQVAESVLENITIK